MVSPKKQAEIDARLAEIRSSQVDAPIKKPESAMSPLIELGKTREALKLANQKAEALKNKMISISEIHEVEGRKRSLSKEDFEQLKNNLSHNPLVNAIVVRARKQGGYEIISGHNRVQAYRELGRVEIEADIRDFEDGQLFEASFYSNLINSTLTDFEKFVGFKQIQNKTNETHEELANRAGVSKSQIASIFNFEKLPLEALDLIKQNPHCIGYNAVSKIVAKDNASINNQAIVKAVGRLVNGEITEAMAVSLSLTKKQKERRALVMAPVKRGGANFAEFTIRKDRMVIDFKEPALSSALMEKIRLLIEEEAKSSI